MGSNSLREAVGEKLIKRNLQREAKKKSSSKRGLKGVLPREA